jgi:hypothetical protein
MVLIKKDISAYSFEPHSPYVSHNALDGELLKSSAIQASVLSGGAKFFCG